MCKQLHKSSSHLCEFECLRPGVLRDGLVVLVLQHKRPDQIERVTKTGLYSCSMAKAARFLLVTPDRQKKIMMVAVEWENHVLASLFQAKRNLQTSGRPSRFDPKGINKFIMFAARIVCFVECMEAAIRHSFRELRPQKKGCEDQIEPR